MKNSFINYAMGLDGIQANQAGQVTENVNLHINKASVVASVFAPAMQDRFAALQQQLENRLMKVVVLGDFKAGKSTIINRLFLNEPILPRRCAECTAVPTHIMNGPRRLQLWKREHGGDEILVKDIPNVTAEELEACVTADNDKLRSSMAMQYSKAVLTMPGILPEGICLVDTPGLNSTNSDIVVGTELEACEADAVLYVHHRTALSGREEQFIRMISGSQKSGIPFFVVLTHDNTQTSAMVESICQEIKSSLAMNRVEVQCAPYNYEGDSMALAGRLKHFFETSVHRGRVARVHRELLLMLEELKNSLQSKLALCDASEQRIASLSNNLADKKAEYLNTVEEIISDVRAEQFTFKKKVMDAISRLATQKKAALENRKDLAEVQQEISRWTTDIPVEINETVEMLRLELERNIRSVMNSHCVRLRNHYASQEVANLSFEPGFLATVPSWLLTVADYVLFSAICPLWAVIDVPLRYVLKDLPIFPVNIATRIIKASAISNLENSMETAKKQIEESLNQSFRSMNAELRNQCQKNGVFHEMQKALEEARAAANTGFSRASLERAVAEVNALAEIIAHN